MTEAAPHSGDQGHGPADSAGIPFHARALTSTGFDDDTGEADPAVLAALVNHVADPELMAAVAGARWLVPVVAVASERVPGPHGHDVDSGVDMAVVTLTSPSGDAALPIFSSLATLAAWDPQARPVPVTAGRAAQSAVSEGCHTLLLDLGADHFRTLRPSMVWALAQQRGWLPAHDDPFVEASVAAAVGGEPAITAYELAEGAPAGEGILKVILTLVAGLDPDRVRDLVTAVGERLATDGEFRARVDGLAFAIQS